jgi:uncharacterized membrane protein
MFKKISLLIVFFSILAIFLSAYLTYSHFKFRKSPEYKSGCSWFSKSKSDPCKKVDASEYSELFGIPVAMFGVGYFFLIFLISLIYSLSKNTSNYLVKKIPLSIFLLSLFGVFFYIYLGYLEIFKIKAICPLCMITFLINILIFLNSIILLKSKFNS